ncbi:TIGR03862 family flavoprotein [Devosia albogilva]|uniref:TIGR03862 family flavoprotein n=1 Tax=Devosia albogilva TaxID=429726 RepID=A0ABW5QJT6_9HYPH
MATIAIIGGGPAGLMAAEVLGGAGHAVTVFEAMPTVGRKLLMAGKSGLNLTHAEPHSDFVARYGAAAERLRPTLDSFTATDVRDWCRGLGVETFVGSSGRVFPTSMKASPLLRAWLARLETFGVTVRTRHRWSGWMGDALRFETPQGPVTYRFDATILTLGGASWPGLGSDAAWVPWLAEKGVAIAPFAPANCGFDVGWSSVFIERFAGQPVKSVRASSDAGAIAGEFVISRHGVEGSLVYAHAAALRDRLAATGSAALTLDLMPGRTADRLAADLARQPQKLSFSNRLRKGAGLDPVKTGLLREVMPEAAALPPEQLAATIKALKLPLLRPRPIEEAISSAGGIRWSEFDERLMLTRLPGTFAAGEMLDWEAPTGGYLLTACLATARAAADGVMRWVEGR